VAFDDFNDKVTAAKKEERQTMVLEGMGLL
jgi:hypothetical protein